MISGQNNNAVVDVLQLLCVGLQVTSTNNIPSDLVCLMCNTLKVEYNQIYSFTPTGTTFTLAEFVANEGNNLPPTSREQALIILNMMFYSGLHFRHSFAAIFEVLNIGCQKFNIRFNEIRDPNGRTFDDLVKAQPNADEKLRNIQQREVVKAKRPSAFASRSPGGLVPSSQSVMQTALNFPSNSSASSSASVIQPSAMDLSSLETNASASSRSIELISEEEEIAITQLAALSSFTPLPQLEDEEVLQQQLTPQKQARFRNSPDMLQSSLSPSASSSASTPSSDLDSSASSLRSSRNSMTPSVYRDSPLSNNSSPLNQLRQLPLSSSSSSNSSPLSLQSSPAPNSRSSRSSMTPSPSALLSALSLQSPMKPQRQLPAVPLPNSRRALSFTPNSSSAPSSFLATNRFVLPTESNPVPRGVAVQVQAPAPLPIPVAVASEEKQLDEDVETNIVDVDVVLPRNELAEGTEEQALARTNAFSRNLRGKSEAMNNCPYLAFYSRWFFENNKFYDGPVITHPNNIDHVTDIKTHKEVEIHGVTVRVKHVVSSKLNLSLNSRLPPPPNMIGTKITPEGKEVEVCLAPRLTQKRVKYYHANERFKKLASDNGGYAIISIDMYGVGKYHKDAHNICGLFTRNWGVWNDPQNVYRGKEKGGPPAFTRLEDNYTFITEDGRYDKNTFGLYIFYHIKNPKPEVMEQPVPSSAAASASSSASSEMEDDSMTAGASPRMVMR